MNRYPYSVNAHMALLWCKMYICDYATHAAQNFKKAIGTFVWVDAVPRCARVGTRINFLVSMYIWYQCS